MPIALFYAGTVVLALAAGLCWVFAEWSFAECFNGIAAAPFWLLVSGVATVMAGFFFVAFICNVIDILSPVWRTEKR